MNDKQDLTPTQPLLTEAQAGRLLGFSPRTLQKWRARGDGPPFVKLSDNRGAVRYRQCDLAAFIEKRLRRSTSDTGCTDHGAARLSPRE